jgi:hypothetical protein
MTDTFSDPLVQGPTDSELLQFLLDNLQSHNLHMDGTAEYNLNTRNWPFNHRASGRREFIEEAHRRYHSGR